MLVGRKKKSGRDASATTNALAGMAFDWSLATQFPRVKSALAFWEKKRGTDILPKGRNIHAIELKEILPFVQLYDIVDASGAYRVRLIGTEISRSFPANMTGRFFDGSNGHPLVQRMTHVLMHVTEQRRPLIARADRSTIDSMGYAAIESAFLPFTDDGERVSAVMATTVMYVPQQNEKLLI